ncbi:MAG TPA: OmpA family protein [Vicinamibacterales bacterium]|nr:OmpA family protein [Vicinamibacterales bacterium]
MAVRSCLPLALVAAAVAASGCTSGDQLRAPSEPGETVVILLPDPEALKVGKAGVSNAQGSVPLDTARAASTVKQGSAPSQPVVMSEKDVQRLFGDALAAMPPAPALFTLYFEFESDSLTPDSRALVPQVLEAVRTRPSPEVTIVGHTDTTGSSSTNFQLGLRRATALRTILVAAGMNANLIELKSHGELDPLVPTDDNVAEPRNRRVDISVR